MPVIPNCVDTPKAVSKLEIQFWSGFFATSNPKEAYGMTKRNRPSSRAAHSDPGSDKESTKWEQPPGRRDSAPTCPLHSYPGQFYAITHESYENRLYSTTITRPCDKKQCYHCGLYCWGIFMERSSPQGATAFALRISRRSFFVSVKPCRCRSPPFHSA